MGISQQESDREGLEYAPDSQGAHLEQENLDTETKTGRILDTESQEYIIKSLKEELAAEKEERAILQRKLDEIKERRIGTILTALNKIYDEIQPFSIILKSIEADEGSDIKKSLSGLRDNFYKITKSAGRIDSLLHEDEQLDLLLDMINKFVRSIQADISINTGMISFFNRPTKRKVEQNLLAESKKVNAINIELFHLKEKYEILRDGLETS